MGDNFHCFSASCFAGLETAALFLAGDREPVLEEPDPAAHEHPLHLGRLPHELQVVPVRRRTP